LIFLKNKIKLDFYKKISVLEVEIGRNGPGIVGVKVQLARGAY
jgi:hypothetical protein